MKRVIKTMITVFVGLACCFAGLVGFGYYISEVQSLSWNVGYHTTVEIKEVTARKLGDSYPGMSKSDCVYYELELIVENPTNALKEGEILYLYYIDDEGFFDNKVSEVPYSYYSDYNNEVIPPGETGKVTRVVCVEDGCSNMKLGYRNIWDDEEEEQVFEITF